MSQSYQLITSSAIDEHLRGAVAPVGHTTDGRVYANPMLAPNSNVRYNNIKWQKVSASPVSNVYPGATTTIDWRPIENSSGRLPDRYEMILLRFDVVNTHATIAGTLLNPVSLIRNIKVMINGNYLGMSTGYTDDYLKEMMAWEYVLPKLMTVGQGVPGIEGSLTELRNGETSTYNGITIAAAGTTRVQIPLYNIFPSLQDFTTRFPGFPGVLQFKLDIEFHGPTGSATTEGKIIKSSTTASCLANLRYDNIHLELQKTELNIAHAAGGPGRLLFHMPQYWSQTKVVDFSLQGNTTLIKLSEISRRKVRRVTFAIRASTSAYNSNNSQKFFSGPEYLALRFDRAGGNDPVDYLSTNADTGSLNSYFQRWQIQQQFGGNSAVPVPPDVLDYSSAVSQQFIPSMTHVDFSHIDVPNGQRVLTYTDLTNNRLANTEDWDITLECLAPDATFTATTELVITLHTDSFFMFTGDGNNTLREIDPE